MRGRLDGSAGTRRRPASGGPGPAGSPEGRGASTDVTSRRAGWVPGCRVARGSRPAAAALDRGGESRTARGPASQSQPGVPLRRASSGTGRAAPREPARVPYHLMKVRGRPRGSRSFAVFRAWARRRPGRVVASGQNNGERRRRSMARHRARAHGCRRVRCRFHGESTGADPGRAGDCFVPLRLRGPPSRGAAGSHGRKKEVRIGKIQRMK